jgi:hypothetical protein
MHQFPKFTPAWNSTCFGQFLCPSSAVYSLHTQQWYMSYRHCTHSFRAGPVWNRVPSWSCSKAVFKFVWPIPLPSVQWINSWWWADELPETCRVSCRSKFGKLVHLVGFIIKKFVRMQHGHMNVKLHVMFMSCVCWLRMAQFKRYWHKLEVLQQIKRRLNLKNWYLIKFWPVCFL